MKEFMNYDFNIGQLTICCYVADGKGKLFHRNRPNHGIAFHCGGEKRYIFESGEHLTVRGGEIIFLPRGSTYRIELLQPGDCYAINFQEEGAFAPFILPIKNAEMLQAFRKAERLWRAKNPGYLPGCKAELYRIISMMQQEQNYLPSEKFDLIRPGVSYIEEHYDTEPLQIARLAELCGMTPEYFRRLFGHFYGCSPVKYINHLKITRAKELLASGMYSPGEAAALAGFTDSSHFSREFKKAEGISPSRYKKEKEY